MKKNQYRYLGFFSLFALSALPGILAGEWGQAVWLVWLVWAIFFFVDPEPGQQEKGDDAVQSAKTEEDSSHHTRFQA